MVLDSMLIDSDVAIKGVHFGILPARYKQLLIDVGSSGNMDWSPVHGDIGEVLPVVKSRFIPVIKALSEEMYALPDAYGMRLREVPVPPEAIAFMADVLAITTDVHDGDEQHATARGRQNLNMTGDMPIAHMELRELLDRLDDALRGGQPPSEVSRLANLIAVRTGQKVAKQSTAKAIAAACLRICRPQEYPSANDAARASGINARQCREWYAKLTAALSKEAEAPPIASDVKSHERRTFDV